MIDKTVSIRSLLDNITNNKENIMVFSPSPRNYNNIKNFHKFYIKLVQDIVNKQIATNCENNCVVVFDSLIPTSLCYSELIITNLLNNVKKI